jgi:hypothetical protein
LEELGLIPSAASALVTNAVFGTLTFLKVRQVLKLSSAFAASEIRKAVIQQCKAEQLRALEAIRRDSFESKSHPTIYGEPNINMFGSPIGKRGRFSMRNPPER